jgi:hypothetical protein
MDSIARATNQEQEVCSSGYLVPYFPYHHTSQHVAELCWQLALVMLISQSPLAAGAGLGQVLICQHLMLRLSTGSR